jgi:acetylornithine deacetylase/succinyl-diaminopimelate desuccinylase-like protein
VIGAAAAARSDYTLDLLARLVAQPSIEGSVAVDRCLDLIEAEVAGLAETLERPINDGLGSLVARFGSGPDECRLTFSGHVDVVPAGADADWSTPPFEPFRQGGRLVGRGTCDMKGGVAAFVGALWALADARLLEESAIELVITGDEEVGSGRGLIPLLKRGLVWGRMAVCGEPTGLRVFLGNRGLVWLSVRVRGSGGHAGMIHRLANPVSVAARLVAALEKIELDAFDKRFDPPKPSLTVTRLDAGASLAAVNVVPETAEVALDRRLLPGENPAVAVAEIGAVVDTVVVPPFTAEVEVLQTWPAYALSGDERIARAATAAVRSCGLPVHTGMDAAANDSSWLHQAGIPTVLLGPGEPEMAHTIDESVTLTEVTDAVAVYAELAARIAGAEAA